VFGSVTRKALNSAIDLGMTAPVLGSNDGCNCWSSVSYAIEAEVQLFCQLLSRRSS